MLADALERMPHAAPMRLIERIDFLDDGHIRCFAGNHASPDYPLRLGGVLYVAALIELGAQAAAAHASLFGMGAAHTGLVLTLGDVTLHDSEVRSADQLAIQAERLHGAENAASYRFAVSQSGADLVTGETLLSMRTAE